MKRRPLTVSTLQDQGLVSSLVQGWRNGNEANLDPGRAQRSVNFVRIRRHTTIEFFGAPDKIKKQPDVFVVMPFAPELKPIYDDHIVPVVNQLGRKASRGDDFFGTGAVMSEIWNAICASQIVIADCTGRNPNVFYEIGVAHTVGKPVILLTQIVEDVPFDLRHIRFIKYELTRRGMQKFEEDLLATLRDEIG